MNPFVKEYQEKRNEGNNEYEAFGMVASHIALRGNIEDLHEVYDYFSDDLLNEEWIEDIEESNSSNLTSYERKMKECGHKQSDFL